MSGTRTMLAAVLFLAGTLSASAQNEQIQGPEDAKCRGEARNLVFSAPNPKRLSPFDLGVETYHACRGRLGAERKPMPGQ
jgi:hypothetical protein